MNNLIKDDIKEKMQEIGYKLFNLRHGYLYFCNFLEGNVTKDYALELLSYSYFIKEYIESINKNYNEIQDILDIGD